MKSREEQLWEYLDGAGEKEKTSLEAQLQSDEKLQQELELRQRLHDHLGQLEAEQPSLRFTQNLMERLPSLYRRIQIKPLISSLWVRTYVAVFTLISATLVGFGLLSSSSNLIPFNLNLEGSSFSLDLDAVIPLRLILIIMSITAAVLYLLWLDQRLRKKYTKV